MDWLLTFAGLALLLGGGDGLVRGAVGIARRAGISPFVVGLTIVGFGTSAPELVVSVDAVIKGVPGIAVGNVIGSNLANMMLVVGIVALLHPPMIERNALFRDGAMLLFATAIFCWAAFSGQVSALGGAMMIGVLIIYLIFSLWLDARKPDAATSLHEHEAEDFAAPDTSRLWVLIALLVVGLIALVSGSHLTVRGATGLARSFGVSEEVIGLSVIAIGTSLPELSASIVAAFRRHSDVCLGNVIGSNIFNLLGIAGAAALAGPLTFSNALLGFDIPVLIGCSVLFLLFLATSRRFQRWEGGVMLLLYCGYIGFHF